MTSLSVNINKIATLRNARGGNVPNLVRMALDIESYGAQGITVHPRPDERHIRYADVREVRPLLTTEFNVEGYPNKEFLALVHDVKPEQVTLVPDGPEVLTSNAGWEVAKNKGFLTDVIAELKAAGMRTSLFLDPIPDRVADAVAVGADRIELYTEAFASGYALDPETAVQPYVRTAQMAVELGIGVNAGHDLDRANLRYFTEHVPNVLEVSIGHALISDALYLGMENTVQLYLRELR